MQVIKEKLSNVKAKLDDKEEEEENASVSSFVEKEIAYEQRKAKEAEAKMHMHLANAEHMADQRYSHELAMHHPSKAHMLGKDRLMASHEHHGHHYPDSFGITEGTGIPTYPPPGVTPATKYL
ncbi:uncharacterized protein LOC143876950 [Tasmannia lanceolata]|uniref:uncharacterized protein LOC143876950 n=1 Tax=Tasmannia lanceolata TaxID=3420 RepID=UPI004064A6FB